MSEATPPTGVSQDQPSLPAGDAPGAPSPLVSLPSGMLRDILAANRDESIKWREMVESERLESRREREAFAKERKAYQRWTLILRSLFFGGPFLLGFLWLIFAIFKSGNWTMGPIRDVVGVVQISGEIKSSGPASADRVVPALEEAFASERTKAIVLKINSPGGLPLESERINAAVSALKAAHNKPVIAIIENVGASAAYMIAMHADEVYSGKYSLVGSVGAVMSGWDFHKAMDKLNIGQRVYASGALKSMLNPFAPQSEAADAKALSLVSSMGAAFVAEMRDARGTRLKEGVDYGTGEVWYGVQAKEIGLVDDISTLEEVIHRKYPGLSAHNFGPAQGGSSFLSKAAIDVSPQAAVDQLIERAWPSIR